MNITIEHDNKTYVVKQGCKYGWILEVCTPTVKEGAKKKENKESYFFPNLELVAKKLTWFEVDATGIQLIVNKNKTNSHRIKSMLEEAL
tara:strand:- start:44 stop:310 length:267 start_codon:yes stop_codon:yes gene_type:complete